MLSKILILLSLLASLTLVASSAVIRAEDEPRFRRCGNPDPSPEYMKNVHELLAAQETHVLATGNSTVDPISIRVDLYFHILAATNELSEGWATAQMMSDQVAVMREVFNPLGIDFTLQGSFYNMNERWANGLDAPVMKQTLRKGDYRALNIYFMKKIPLRPGEDGSEFDIGGCSLPQPNVQRGSIELYMDGCTVLSATLPGNSFEHANHGMTTIHEVGHWFGLLHTWYNGCSEGTWYKMDTPAQLSGTIGCPIGRNSCPDMPGVDPIHNYMDASYDTCMHEFTPGQINYMRNSWNTFRKNWA